MASSPRSRQTCCQPVQLLPSGRHNILSRTSCSALPWLQRWKGWSSKLWEHTHAAARWWLWQPSGDDAALSLHTELPPPMSCNMLTFTVMCFFPFPLFRKHQSPLMNISLHSCYIALLAADRLIHYRPVLFLFFAPVFPKGISTSHPSPHPAPQCSVDMLSIIPRHTTHPTTTSTCHRLVNSTSAGSSAPAASLWDFPSPSWWFTVLLHKVAIGMSQCLNTETPDEDPAGWLMQSFSLFWISVLKIIK